MLPDFEDFRLRSLAGQSSDDGWALISGNLLAFSVGTSTCVWGVAF